MEELKTINKILENNKNIIGLSCKISIVEDMQNFENYQALKEEEKAKLLDFIYSFWIHNDFLENTLFDIIYQILNNSNIQKEIKNINFKTFENITNELI